MRAPDRPPRNTWGTRRAAHRQLSTKSPRLRSAVSSWAKAVSRAHTETGGGKRAHMRRRSAMPPARPLPVPSGESGKALADAEAGERHPVRPAPTIVPRERTFGTRSPALPRCWSRAGGAHW
ncbi:hypothetical protein GCM10010433_45320 [Streptomyces pulveraceus]